MSQWSTTTSKMLELHWGLHSKCLQALVRSTVVHTASSRKIVHIGLMCFLGTSIYVTCTVASHLKCMLAVDTSQVGLVLIFGQIRKRVTALLCAGHVLESSPITHTACDEASPHLCSSLCMRRHPHLTSCILITCTRDRRYAQRHALLDEIAGFKMA